MTISIRLMLMVAGLLLLTEAGAEMRDPAGGALPEPASTSPLSEPVGRPGPGARSSAGHEEQTPASVAAFRLMTNRCIAGKQFSLFALSGAQAGESGEWYLKMPDTMMRLTARRVSSRELTLSLPETSNLQALQAYPLYFKSASGGNLIYSGQAVFFCPDQGEITPRRRGELLLLVPTKDLDSVVQKLKTMGLVVAEQNPLLDTHHLLTIRGSSDAWAEQQLKRLRQAFPDLTIDFNDFYQPASDVRLYARDLLGWPDKSCLPGGEGNQIKLGIIDGDINLRHPSLQDRIIHQQRFVSQPAKDTDHATAIAVILIGNQVSQGLMGLLGNANVYSAAVVESSAYGDVASVSAIVQALHWLHRQQVRLVSLSLAGRQANRILEMALSYARRQGMLLFAAAGNERLRQQPAYPAAFEAVFAITAVDAAQRLYDRANQGEYIDFAAPGVDLWTASSQQTGQYRSGTSYAVPHALAVTATLLQINPALSAELVYESLRRLSKDLGTKGRDEKFGWGLLQYPQRLCQ
jgi:Subtilase family